MGIYHFLFLCMTLCATCLAQPTPEDAFSRLKEGNQRFMGESSEHPDRVAERRQETAEKQEPFAAIVACSDSRVAPEIVFDQGIGDLFIVRVAGNVVGPLELDSIDYSVIYLHAPFILVMGHQNCGAIDAVIHGITKDVENVAKLIQPAVDKVKKGTDNTLENAIKMNARMTAQQIRKHKVLANFIKQKKLDVKAGYYNFETGEVEILSD